MDINEVKEIIKMIDTSSIGELKIETSDFKMELKRPSTSSGSQENKGNNEKNKNSEDDSKDKKSNKDSKEEESEDGNNKKSEGNIKNKNEDKKENSDEQKNSGERSHESCNDKRTERREESYDRYPERPGNAMNNIHVIKSPIVGTYYASPTPYEPSLVKVGSHIRKGDVLCIIEAMKLMNEIKSDVDGEVAEVHVKNEKLVEYGQPLFTIRI